MIRHPVLTDPTLRMVALLTVLFGAVACTIGPYMSLLAVREFGLGDSGYAALLVISTGVSVAASVYVGIRADQTANRRGMALRACFLSLAGAALMTIAPNVWVFVLAHGLILPLSSTLFGQIFAQARLAALAYPDDRRDAIMATIRALFALPFVVVLPLWSLAFTAGAPVLWVYPACLILAGAMTALTWHRWPQHMGGQDRPSGLSFRAALRELAHPQIALRLLALGAVNAGGTIYMALIGLVLTPEVGRGTADVALYAGLVAGAEVPFMLALPLISGRISRTKLILIGAAIYGLHVIGLPLLAHSAWLWLMILPAAIGGALILTLPIAYLQDLLADRPGTGASLMALQRLTGDILAAACFVIGTALSGYTLVAVLGASAGVLAALWLHKADKP